MPRRSRSFTLIAVLTCVAFLHACTYKSNLVLSRPSHILIATGSDADAQACLQACTQVAAFASCLDRCPGRTIGSGVCPQTLEPGVACATQVHRVKTVRDGDCESQRAEPHENIVSCDTDRSMTGVGPFLLVVGGIAFTALLGAVFSDIGYK